MKSADWDALIPDLKDWNSGKGVDAEAWVGCEGNFRLAAAYSLIFWPEFTELDGMIFRGQMDRETLASWMHGCSGDRRCVEATANHLHILDLHHSGCPDASIERIVYLGNVLKEIYQAKLAALFPGRNVVVEFYEPPDKELQGYQLTFYQRHEDESGQARLPLGSCRTCRHAPRAPPPRQSSSRPDGIDESGAMTEERIGPTRKGIEGWSVGDFLPPESATVQRWRCEAKDRP